MLSPARMRARTPQPANSCWKAGRASRLARAASVYGRGVADPFYIDLSLLAKVNGPVKNGTAIDLSSWRPESAKNSFAGTMVESIVLEISHEHPQLKPGAHIGVWCATKLATDAGGWRQINRGGHPMIWPIFRADDTHFTNPADADSPFKAFEAEREHISQHIAAVVAASGTSGDPQGYAQTVARELFPDVLSYTVGTPAIYGFATRNGRPLADNAPEAMLSLVVGTAVPSGLKPSVAKNQRDNKFPYVVPA